MRLGVVLVQSRPWSVLGEQFRVAEQIGYDAVYVYDHLTHPTARGGWLADGFTTLAAAAAVTERIELGPLVASAMLHSPVSLARRAATVQDVSGGRLVLGLGAGALQEPLADEGVSLDRGQLSARFHDVVTGLDAVWRGETAWTGNTRGFSGLETTPLPPGGTRPFLLLAAHGPRALRLAARYADGWNTYGGWQSTGLAADEFWRTIRTQRDGLHAACEAEQRDPATLRHSLLLGFGSVKPTATQASYEDAVAQAEGAGFDELVVYGPDPLAPTWDDVDVHAAVLAARRNR